MADEKIGPIPEPAMTDEELMELMENIFTPGAGAIKTAGKVIPKIGKEAIKILNKILNRNKKAIKNIEQSNKIREKLNSSSQQNMKKKNHNPKFEINT